MSAVGCVIYIGLRYDIEVAEIETLEAFSDSRQTAARYAGLRRYWAKFGGPDERYVLFVETKFAVLGPEGNPSISLASQEVADVIVQAYKKLDRTSI